VSHRDETTSGSRWEPAAQPSTSTPQSGVSGLDTDGDGVPDTPPSFGGGAGGRAFPPGMGDGTPAVPPGATEDGTTSGTTTEEGDPA
jgi:hypothetical protein